MRTARRVIVCLLSFCAAAGLWAQQPKPADASVDSSVTVTGRDDSLIAVPAPGSVEDELGLPPVDRMLADTLDNTVTSAPVPAGSPPVAEIPMPPRDALLLPAALRPNIE